MRKPLTAAAAAFLLAGCVGTPLPTTRGFVRYVDTVGPEYRAYVDADESLSPEEKARRGRTVDDGKLLADSVREDVGLGR